MKIYYDHHFVFFHILLLVLQEWLRVYILCSIKALLLVFLFLLGKISRTYNFGYGNGFSVGEENLKKNNMIKVRGNDNGD